MRREVINGYSHCIQLYTSYFCRPAQVQGRLGGQGGIGLPDRHRLVQAQVGGLPAGADVAQQAAPLVGGAHERVELAPVRLGIAVDEEMRQRVGPRAVGAVGRVPPDRAEHLDIPLAALQEVAGRWPAAKLSS